MGCVHSMRELCFCLGVERLHRKMTFEVGLGKSSGTANLLFISHLFNSTYIYSNGKNINPVNIALKKTEMVSALLHFMRH